MTPEAQRIAIAKACGWTNYPAFEGQSPASAWDDKAIHSAMADSFPWISPSGKYSPRLPDYLNDLNAMHKAEKTLTWDQKIQMHNDLCMKIPISEMVWCATAAQRAEAFLKTLNLWTE